MFNLAEVLLHAGRSEESRGLYEQGLAVVREIGGRSLEGWPLVRMAGLERRVNGKPGKAARLLAEAGRLFAESGDWLGLYVCHCERGHRSLASGRSAREPLRRARRMVEQLGCTPESWLSAALGRLERAQAAFEAGRPLYRGELWEDLPAGLRQWLQERGEGPST
jgi:hypothetical protein